MKKQWQEWPCITGTVRIRSSFERSVMFGGNRFWILRVGRVSIRDASERNADRIQSSVLIYLRSKLSARRQLSGRTHLGIEYRVSDVTELELDHRFDVVTAIHLLHYLENGSEIELALRKIFALLVDHGRFVTMIANPEFDIEMHDESDSKTKFGYYFSLAEPGNGGMMRFHPGGFEKEKELTVEFRRWERHFINSIAMNVGFAPEWHDPFITAEGLNTYGATFFENYLANPQSKLLVLSKT